MTLEELRLNGDWAQVFADENWGNVPKDVEAVPPGAQVSTARFSRNDVVEIIASHDGEYDADDWVGVFLLDDGRYVAASGWCDYSGWDWLGGSYLAVARTLDDAIRFGLTADNRRVLGLLLEEERDEVDEDAAE